MAIVLQRPRRRLEEISLVAIVIIAMAVIAFAITQGQQWMVNRDFFTYWGGGRGVLEGANIYDRDQWSAITYGNGSTWLPNLVFIYAPPTAMLFAPLSALPIQVAAFFWVLLTEVLFASSAILVVRDLRLTVGIGTMSLWVLAVALFMPVLLTVIVGQISGLILLLIVVTAVLWNHGRWFAGGMVLGLAIVKPQPVALLLALVGLWLILNGRTKALIGMASSLGLSAAGSILLFPNFLGDWLPSVLSKVGGVAGNMPTVWGVSKELSNSSQPAFWIGLGLAILAAVVGIVLAERLKDKDALTAVAALLVPSLLAAPYLWDYDQVLLLVPLFAAVARLQRRGSPSWSIRLLPLFSCALALVLFLIAAVRVRDTLGVFLTLSAGALLWFSYEWRINEGVRNVDTQRNRHASQSGRSQTGKDAAQ